MTRDSTFNMMSDQSMTNITPTAITKNHDDSQEDSELQQDNQEERRLSTTSSNRSFHRSFSVGCDCDEITDLNSILRDADNWRDPQEVNCFLKDCNCTPKSGKSRKISFVRFEDEISPIQKDEDQNITTNLESDQQHEEEPYRSEDDSEETEDLSEEVRTRPESLYSVKEEDLDENENSVQIRETVIHLYPKIEETLLPKTISSIEETNKKNFFKSLFSRSSGSPKLRKSVSVMDINSESNKTKKGFTTTTSSPTNNTSVKRQSSFLKRTLDGAASKLTRTLSVRRLSEKREAQKIKEQLSDVKGREWAASLQSLVETDIGVSYDDLSFIDYDRNGDSFHYNDYLDKLARRTDRQGDAKSIYRTQSMIVNKGQTHHFVRHKSVSGISNANLNLSNNNYGGAPRRYYNEDIVQDDVDHAQSLPCLINQQKQRREARKLRGRSLPFCTHEGSVDLEAVKYLGESQDSNNNINRSISSILRNSDVNQGNNNSTRTTKLKRQNACRQKSNPSLAHQQHQCFQRLQQQRSTTSGGTSSCGEQQQLAGSRPCRGYYHSERKDNESSARVYASVEHMLTEPPTSGQSVRAELKCRSLDLLDLLSKSKDSSLQYQGARIKDKRGGCSSPSDVGVKPRKDVTTVRSRSLNHLDTLEMRQGNASVASVGSSCGSALPPEAAIVSSGKSESDCTLQRPLLAPPEQSNTNVSPSSTSTTPSPTYRRHMLSRSQKSSSECFSVNFEVGDEATYDTELFFPAARGVTLHESLAKLCELRNIDLSTCDVWLFDKETNDLSWLSLSQDTACLVGKHVKITSKDSRSKHQATQQLPSATVVTCSQLIREPQQTNYFSSHARKLSGNFRPRTTSFFSSSTEECSTGDFDAGKKQTKQRWSTNLFGNSKDTKQTMEQLIEHLNHYSRYGVPRTQSYTLARSDSQEALNKLEDDWREIIDVTELNDKQQKQQTALWELIKTEVAYVKTLKVVTDLFLACLVHLQAANILRDIDTAKLFSNIGDILDANVQFWRLHLFPIVKQMRATRKPPCLDAMRDGFLKLKDCFHAYYRFCGEQSRCQHYCRENLAHNDLFTAYLAWCETQKECNRLRLMDILVQPMQRLTKYGLLLKAILRNTEDDEDKDNLNIMIRSVDDFVNNVNFSLKQKQDNERLKGIIARIESYDIVETKDDDLEKLIKNYNQLDLTKPMLGCPPERRRHLLLEGDLKLKDSNTSKMEVHCFLLTDMLLVCKQSTKKGGATMRVVRQPYLIDKLVITEINKETPTLACVYKNELDMAVGAFLLQNSDAKKLKSWKEGISKAQTLYAQAKHSHISAETESIETEYSFEYAPDTDYHYCLQAPRSPLASSSRASRVSSLAHSHSGSVEMNDQSSLGSCKAVSVENDQRTASISSDEGVQSLPPDQKSPSGGSTKSSFKGHRMFTKTPNTLSVQPTYAHHLGQSLPNLALGSPSTLNNNTLSVPSASKTGQLLSPTSRGISYPPPSPTRGNLRRGMAISQSKNPPLIKTRHVTSSAAGGGEFDVPVIAGVSPEDTKDFGDFNRGYHRQAMKRAHRSDNKRYYTAGTVDDIKKEEASTSGIQKRSSWNCSSSHHSTKSDQNT